MSEPPNPTPLSHWDDAMKPEDVPQQWRTLMIAAIQDALDDNMTAEHYVDIERMVDEGIAAVAPLIAAAEREACAKVAEAMADSWAADWRAERKASSHLEGKSDGADEVAAAIRARATSPASAPPPLSE